MGEFLFGLLVGLALVAALGVGAYVILRRLFERASHRVADQIGHVLSEASDRAMATAAGRKASSSARAAASRLSHLGAYAAAEGVSEDAARREFADRIERLARLMDGAVQVPILGKVGLDALLGLIPGVGDVASASVAVLLVARSLKYGIPRDLIARMLGNVLLDFVMGSVPILGDLADIWFKANTRNVTLLREYLKRTGPP